MSYTSFLPALTLTSLSHTHTHTRYMCLYTHTACTHTDTQHTYIYVFIYTHSYIHSTHTYTPPTQPTHTHFNTHHTYKTHIYTDTHVHTHIANHYWKFLEGSNQAIHRCGSKPVRNSIKLDWIKLQKARSIPILWIHRSLSDSFKFSLSLSFCPCAGPSWRRGLCFWSGHWESRSFSLWSCASPAYWDLQRHSATCCRHPHSDWGKAAKYCGMPLFFKTQVKLQLINIY